MQPRHNLPTLNATFLAWWDDEKKKIEETFSYDITVTS